MDQLSSIDSSYIYTEDPKLPMHIATVTIYDPSSAPQGTVRLKDIINVFERAAYNVPLFRQRLVEVPLGLDQPYWIDDPDFDIEYHIRHIGLPKPGDWRQFYIQLARINSRPLDRSRPLWEIYVIEGLNSLEGVPSGSFAIMMKLHHAALDAESLMSLYMSVHTLKPEAPGKQVEFDHGLRREVRRGKLPLMINASQNSIKRAFLFPRMVNGMLRGYRRIRHGVDSGDIKKHHPTPLSPFNGQLSPYRAVTSFSAPFEQARKLKSAIDGATLNDLVLTIVAGALRLYLGDKNALPEDSMVAQTPINLTSGDAATEHKISLANMPLHTEIADPLERFYAVHEESASARNYLLARGEDLPQEFGDALHPYLSRSLLKIHDSLQHVPVLSQVYPAAPNTLVSNMPGLSEPVYLCGAKVVTSLGLDPCMPGIGLSHTATVSAGQLVISVNACREMMDDPGFYQQCLQQSWDLVQAALNPEAKRHQGKKSASRKRKKSATAKAAGSKA